MPEIMGGLRALGRRHLDNGVTGADCDKGLHSLIKSLEEFLAEDFTSEVHHAWRTAYGLIAETMIDAADN